MFSCMNDKIIYVQDFSYKVMIPDTKFSVTNMNNLIYAQK